jgi:acetaldehyde dehydrogenase (acetylating)
VCEALRSQGAPDGLVSCMEEVSLAGTDALMRHDLVGLVLATGSAAMVRAAYSTGKPTYAVGPGNVPSLIDASVADPGEAAVATLTSSVFDHGTPCASEQAVVVDRRVAARVRATLEDHGARFLTDGESQRLARALFTSAGTFEPDCVGQSPQALAERAGLAVDPAATALVVSPGGVGPAHPLSMEILTSTLKWYEVDGTDAGIALANALLAFGGLGHTAGVWAGDERVVAAFAARARAFRVIVNSPTCFGAMGATTGLVPSFMLGTGTWGGSITADNIGPLHLLNRKRLAPAVRAWREVAQPPPRTGVPGTAGGVSEELVRAVLDRLAATGVRVP